MKRDYYGNPVKESEPDMKAPDDESTGIVIKQIMKLELQADDVLFVKVPANASSNAMKSFVDRLKRTGVHNEVFFHTSDALRCARRPQV